MRTPKGLVTAISLMAAGWLLMVYGHGSPEAKRLKRNQTAIFQILIGLMAWEASDCSPTDDLKDIVELGALEEIPLYLGADRVLKPFLYFAGYSASDAGSSVWLAGPETEPDGTVLLAHIDGQCDYVPAGKAAGALQLSRAMMDEAMKRILERKKRRASQQREPEARK